MKKKVNLIIITLMSVVIVWGIIASILTLTTLNPKNQRATFDKNGKQIVTYEVSDDDKYRYVKKLDIEIITRFESYQRNCKYHKILMKKAKENYNADTTDTKLILYNQSVASYKMAVADTNTYRSSLFLSSVSVFFDPYVIIVILLGVALLINLKIDYNQEKQTSDEPTQ